MSSKVVVMNKGVVEQLKGKRATVEYRAGSQYNVPAEKADEWLASGIARRPGEPEPVEDEEPKFSSGRTELPKDVVAETEVDVEDEEGGE